MSIIIEVVKELFSMFVADARLAVGVLFLVALVAFLVDYLSFPPLAGGGLLLVGSLLIVIEATVRQARG